MGQRVASPAGSNRMDRTRARKTHRFRPQTTDTLARQTRVSAQIQADQVDAREDVRRRLKPTTNLRAIQSPCQPPVQIAGTRPASILSDGTARGITSGE